MLQQHFQIRQQMRNSIHKKIRYVQQLARECGVQESNQQLWFALHMITKDDDSMEFFIGTSTPEGRLAFIEHYTTGNNYNLLS